MTDHLSDPHVEPQDGYTDDRYEGGYESGYAAAADYVDDDYAAVAQAGDAYAEPGTYYDEDSRRDVERLRPAAEVEGRTSWAYLIMLAAIFLLLVVFSWACNDRSDDTAGAGPAMTPDQVEGQPVRLMVAIEDEIVVLSGNVPDEAAKGQILTAAQAQYGSENVVDEMEIVEGSVLEDGTVSIAGRAEFGDPRPENLRTAIVGNFGLEEANFSVTRGDAALVPTDVEAVASGSTVRLAGQVPDQASIDDLTAAAEQIWGQGNVDNSGLSIGETTWADGRVRVTGETALGFSAEGFPAAVQASFGPSVVVDLEGLSVDVSAEALAEVEEQINTDLAAQPILFAPESTDIDEASDQILAQIAETLNSLPEVAVEVVGHTDNIGDEDENLVLSPGAGRGRHRPVGRTRRR